MVLNLLVLADLVLVVAELRANPGFGDVGEEDELVVLLLELVEAQLDYLGHEGDVVRVSALRVVFHLVGQLQMLEDGCLLASIWLYQAHVLLQQLDLPDEAEAEERQDLVRSAKLLEAFAHVLLYARKLWLLYHLQRFCFKFVCPPARIY